MENIVKKFKFRNKPAVINAPPDLKKEFVQLGFKTSVGTNEKSANTLVFINDRKELLAFLQDDLRSIEPDSVLWLAYPKGSAKVKTDINRDTIRATAEEFKITTVAAISIDETWSALRFRPIEKVGT